MEAIAIAMSATSLDRYVFDTLMRDLVGHDRRPAAYLVYVALAAEAQRGRRTWSHSQLAGQTGLSKRTIQDSLRHLATRELIKIQRDAPTEAGLIEVLAPWQRHARRLAD